MYRTNIHIHIYIARADLLSHFDKMNEKEQERRRGITTPALFWQSKSEVTIQ